jgi:hypothetical protein
MARKKFECNQNPPMQYRKKKENDNAPVGENGAHRRKILIQITN